MPGRFDSLAKSKTLRGLLVRDDGRAVRFAVDRDRARLLGLGNLPHQIDVQETVFEARALHLDKISELEYALEAARCNALIEHVPALLLVFGGFFAADRQRVLL